MTDRPPAGSRGFTIIELLAATAVFLLMITLLISAVSQVNRAWQSSDGQKMRRESARALLDLMARDLQSTISPLPGSSSSSSFFSLNPGGSATPYGDTLYWNASTPGNRNQSDVATVGYFVHPDTRALCRFATNAPPGFSLTDAAALGAGMRPEIGNDFQGLLAEGVMGFFVTLFDRNGDVVGRTGDQRDFTTRPPAAAELVLVLADSRAQQRLTAFTNVLDTLDALPEGVQAFRTRVDIPSGQ